MRIIDKIDKVSTGRAGQDARRRRGAVLPIRSSSAWRSPPSARPDASFADRVRRWASRIPCWTRAWPSWPRWSTAARASPAPGDRRGRPADSPRSRLLHRHRVRDPDVGPRTARVDLLRRPLRLVGERRPDDLSRRRHLAWASPACSSRCCPAACSTRSPVRAQRGAGCAAGRGQPALVRGDRRRVAGARDRGRGVGVRGEVRPADQIRRAARNPVRLVPDGPGEWP